MTAKVRPANGVSREAVIAHLVTNANWTTEDAVSFLATLPPLPPRTDEVVVAEEELARALHAEGNRIAPVMLLTWEATSEANREWWLKIARVALSRQQPREGVCVARGRYDAATGYLFDKDGVESYYTSCIQAKSMKQFNGHRVSVWIVPEKGE